MPKARFEMQTLGLASSDEDHYTMPLPPSSISFCISFLLYLFHYFEDYFFRIRKSSCDRSVLWCVFVCLYVKRRTVGVCVMVCVCERENESERRM